MHIYNAYLYSIPISEKFRKEIVFTTKIIITINM